MRYLLSKLIPMRFTSTYRTRHGEGPWYVEHSTWWQWRNRIMAHKAATV